MFEVPLWSKIQNPCAVKSRNSDHLLITVGDSWTYGDSLGLTKVRDGIDDPEYRLANVYGNIISEQLGYDWINLALPGGSNFCVLNWLGQLLNQKYNYQDITCIITLTEAGRHEELRWAQGVLLQEVLEHIVHKTYAMINELKLRFPNVVFKITHNFTDSASNQTLDCTWLEVLTDTNIQNNTFIVISEHIKQLNYTITYPDTPEVIDRALARIDVLDACKYCHKEDSRHPTEVGHQMWADYLLTQL